MKKIFFSLWIALFLFAGCKTEEKKYDRIVVSIPPQAYIARHLLGEDAAITTIIGSNTNPETFEPAMNTMFTLMNSDVYFPVGTLEFEKKLIKNASLQKEGINVVDCSADGIKLLYGTHDDCDHSHGGHHHHSGNMPDPHIWSTPGNMSVISQTMAAELCRLYPKKEEEIKANLEKLQNRFGQLDSGMKNVLSDNNVEAFMIWHPSLSYFADTYNLEQINIGSGSKEASAKKIADRFGKASEKKAKVLFLQKEFDPAQTKPFVGDLNIRTVVINQMSENWEDEFIKMTEAFRQINGEDN